MTSNQLKTQLDTALRGLRLPTVRAVYAESAESARREGLSFERYLLEVALQEVADRRQRRVERLLRDSRIPAEKSFASFDRARLPAKVDAQVGALIEGGFLTRTENVLAFGNPGTGKTHLLCAIGQALIEQGYRVLFRPCSLLVQELLLAKRDLVLPKLLKRLSRYDALVIDDIGYVQQSRDEMEVLFTLLAQAYERQSILLTSNLAFSDWEQIFKNPMTTAAAIDRLVHHSIILELNLTSYRLESSKKRRKETATTTSPEKREK